MAERHTKVEGLDLEFLVGQSAGLLPDRLEMHRRRHHGHHGRRNVNKTLVLVIQDDGNLFQNGIYYPPIP